MTNFSALVSLVAPSPNSSPSLYCSFTSPVSRRTYFAFLSGAALIVQDTDTNIEAIIDLRPLIQPSGKDSGSDSSSVSISALSISDTQQIAIAIGSNVYIGALTLDPAGNTVSASDSTSVSDSGSDSKGISLSSKLILGSDEEQETVHQYDSHAEYTFHLHRLTSLTAKGSVLSLAWRMIGIYHFAQLAACGINWVSLYQSAHDSDVTQWEQCWYHSETPNLFPSPPAMKQLSRSQPNSPATPSVTMDASNNTNIASLSVSDDGRVLARCSQHPSTELTVHNLDTVTKRPWSLSHPSPLLAFSFCPNTPPSDNLLATLCTDGVIRFWRQNKIRGSAGCNALANLSPLTPAIVSERTLPHSASAEFHTNSDKDKFSIGNGLSAPSSIVALSHAQSTPHSLSALKSKHADNTHTDVSTNNDDDASDNQLARSIITAPSVLEDQMDYDWFVCSELELGSSGSSASLTRNGYVSCLFVNDSLAQRSVEATVCMSAMSAKFVRDYHHSHHDSHTGSSNKLQSLPSPPSQQTMGLITSPSSPSPRVLTVDREGTIQLWYLKDILAVPRTNPTPLPLLTLYHSLPTRYVSPWLYTASTVKLLPSKSDLLLNDFTVAGLAGLASGECLTFTLTVNKQERGREQEPQWRGNFVLGRLIGGHRQSAIIDSQSQSVTPPVLMAHPSARYAATLSSNGHIGVWSLDDSQLLFAAPGGDVQFEQLLVSETSRYTTLSFLPSISTSTNIMLAAASDGFVDIWQLTNIRKGFELVAHAVIDAHSTSKSKHIAGFVCSAPGLDNQLLIVCATDNSVVLLTVPTQFADSNALKSSSSVRIVQTITLPTSHSSASLECAATILQPHQRFAYTQRDRQLREEKTKEAAELSSAEAESERECERVIVVYGGSDGGVSVVSVNTRDSEPSLLTHYQAYQSPVTAIQCHSLDRIVTVANTDNGKGSEEIKIWQGVTHFFDYELEYTLTAPLPLQVPAKSQSYFATHAVTNYVRATSPRSTNTNTKKSTVNFGRSVSLIDVGDGRTRIIAGDRYGQLHLYSPSATGWSTIKFTDGTALPSQFAIISLKFCPHTLGVIVCGYQLSTHTPVIRHLRLHTLFQSLSSSTLSAVIADSVPHLPDYHPRALEAAMMTGHINRVKNVLWLLYEQVVQRVLTVSGDTVKLTNIPIEEVIDSNAVLSHSAVPASSTVTQSQSAAASDSCQISMSSFGGSFGSFGSFGGGFGAAAMSSPSQSQSSFGPSSSLTPAITTYQRPTPIIQNEPTDRELTALLQTLETKRLPFLNTTAQSELTLVVRALMSVMEQEKTLDEFGQRYYFAAVLFRLRVPYPAYIGDGQTKKEENAGPVVPYSEQLAALPSMPSLPIAFAYHSSSIETLVSLAAGPQAILPPTGLSWEVCRSLGLGYWLRGSDLSSLVETVARSQYIVAKNPNDCFLFYLALNKKSVLLGLMKQNSKYEGVYHFMSQDFTQQEAKTAASKNAFRALTKRKFHLAAGFFLLAGMLSDAVNMCFRQMNDPQLAIVLCRLVEGEHSPLLRKILIDSLLPFAETNHDIVGQYLALHMLKQFHHACQVLISGSGREGEARYDPAIASLLRLIDHSKARLFAVPHHILNQAARKSAFEFARQGLGLLAMEEFPSNDNSLPPEDEEEATLPAATESTVVAPASGSLPSGFGSFGSFGSSPTASWSVSLVDSGQLGSFGGGFGGGFGQANTNSGQVAMMGGFGQSSTPNASTGALGGSFGSFGSFGSAPAPTPAATPASMNLASFGSFGASAPAATPAPSVPSSFAATVAAPVLPPRPTNARRSAHVTDTAHRAFLASMRLAFLQLSSDLFLASRAPLATVTVGSDEEVVGVIADILALQARFPINAVRSVQSITAYTLIYGHTAAYLALTLQSQSAAIHATPVYQLPQGVDQLLRKETHALSSLLRHASFHHLDDQHWDQIGQFHRDLNHWRSMLSSQEMTETNRDEWNLLNALLNSALLLWSMRERDYTTISATLEGRFAAISQSEPISLTQRQDDEAREKAKRDAERDDDDDASLGLPPIVSSLNNKTDFFVPLKREIALLVELIYFHTVLHHHQKNFTAAFLSNTSTTNGRLQEFHSAFVSAINHLSALTLEQFQCVMARLSYHKSDYEYIDPDDHPNTTKQFPLHALLVSLHQPQQSFPFGQPLLRWTKLETLLPKLGAEIERYFECERGTNSSQSQPQWFHSVLDVFKLTEKNDSVASVAINPVQPKFLAIGGSFGLREIDTLATLRFRERSKDEESSFHSVLHRYDKLAASDKEDILAESQGASFPRPKKLLSLILHCQSQSQPSQSNVFGSSLLHSRVYEDFIGPSVRDQLIGGSSSKEAVERDWPVSHVSAHPSLPLYVSVSNGRVLLWHFGWPQPLAEFSPRASMIGANGKRQTVGPDKSEHVTRVVFNGTGNRLAACTDHGRVFVWVFAQRGAGLARATSKGSHGTSKEDQAILAYDCFEAHSRTCTDLSFIDGGQLLATAGDSGQGTNICVWSLLLPADERLCIAFKCHEASQGAGGASSLAYIANQSLIVAGGSRGSLVLCDIHAKSVVKRIEFGRSSAASSRITALHYDAASALLVAANGEGVVRVYDSSIWSLMAEYTDWFPRQSSFLSGLTGITDVVSHRASLYFATADGTVKYVRKKRAALVTRDVCSSSDVNTSPSSDSRAAARKSTTSNARR